MTFSRAWQTKGHAMCRRAALIGLLLLFVPAFGRAETQSVDLVLVLAVDASLSISDSKFELERRGYAEAFQDPLVLRSIANGPEGKIAVALVEWAGPEQQQIVVGWTVIGSREDAAGFAAKLTDAPRSFNGRTAVGSALLFSADLIERSPFETTRRVIDVSGDGTSNGGVDIATALSAIVGRSIVINGIIILTNPIGLPSYLVAHTNPPGGLVNYYRDTVVGGQGSFVMKADSFETFGKAIIAKLIREIS